MGGLLALAAAGSIGAAIVLVRDKPSVPPGARPTTAPIEVGLDATIDRVLAKIHQQEAQKDATCWTTVRMMEGHQVALPLDDFAVVAKIEASKLLLYRLWRRASVIHDTPRLTATHIDPLVPDAVRPLLEPLGPGAATRPVPGVETAVRDYHRVTENLRLLLSLLYDAGLAGGLFATVGVDLRPLDDTAIDRLAQTSTGLTVLLLQAARRAAEQRHHARIEANDLQVAFQEIATATGLNDEAEQRLRPPPPPTGAPTPTARARFSRVTERYVVNKIQSLRAWNSAVWQALREGGDKAKEHAALADLLGRLAEMPLSLEGTERFIVEVAAFGDLLLSGWTPLRTDTFESSLAALARQRAGGGTNDRATYLGVAGVSNALASLFPHETLPNGDVHFVMTKNREHRRFRLLGPSADAMRDVTVHWYVLSKLLARPDALPLEPFAAELVAERISEMALHLLLEAARAARSAREPAIGKGTFERLSWKYPNAYFIDDPDRPTRGWSWTEEDEAHKRRALAPYPAPLFLDVTATSGITQKPCTKPADPNAEPPFVELQQYMGSGVAVGDFDGDRLPDLFLAADACNRMYRNLGGYKFEDVTLRSGITGLGEDARQPLFADIDGDGLLDLFVAQSHNPSRLFRQIAPGRWMDVTDASGIRSGPGAHTGAFFDADLDGDLDLFVGTYGAARREDRGGPSIDGRNGRPNQLWRNDGKGRFEEVGASAHLASTAWTLAVQAYDVDGDGDQDVQLANDFGRDELYLNQGDGTFREVAESWGSDDRGSGMNVSAVDIDGDGRLDSYVSMVDMFSKSIGFVLPTARSIYRLDDRIISSSFYISGNKLYVNEGGRFRASEQRYFEPGDRGWSWSSNFFDYDNDGDEDLYIANGWSERTANWYQANQLYLRDGDRFFLYPGASRRWEEPQGTDRGKHRGLEAAKVVSAESYLGSSRAVASVDLTGTGRTDLVVVDYHDPPRILRNLSHTKHAWLKVRLRGRKNRFGIGAVVHLRTPDGLQARVVTAGGHYLSQDDVTMTFGLGEHANVTGLEVVWPGGRKQTVAGPYPIRGTLEVDEP